MRTVISDETKHGRRVIEFDDCSVMTINNTAVNFSTDFSWVNSYYVYRLQKWTNLNNELKHADYSLLSEEELFQQSTVEDVDSIIQIQNLMKYYGDIN